MRRGSTGGHVSARHVRAAGGLILFVLTFALLGPGPLPGHAQVPCLPPLCATPTPAPSPTPSPPPPTAGANPTPSAAPSSAPPAGVPPPGQAPPPGGAPAASLGPSAAPPAATKPSPPPSPPATAGAAAGRLAVLGIVDDPVLAGQVSAIIEHPVAADRPFLRHFRIASGGGGRPGRAGKESGRGWRLATALFSAAAVTTLGGLALIALAVRRRRRRTQGSGPERVAPGLMACRSLLHRFVDLRRLRLWTSRVAVLGLAAVVSAYVVTGVSTAGRLLQMAAVAHPVVPSVQTHFVTRFQPATASRSATWARLVSIEQNLAVSQQELAAQEARVTNLTRRLEQQSPPAVSTAPTPQAPTPASAPAANPALTNDLARTVNQHQAELIAYQKSLESEYQLFAAAAADPAQRAELLAAAGSAGPPDVSSVVAFDLSVVEAQLSQESAIQAAEAQSQAQGPPPVASKLLKAAGRPALIPPLGGVLTLGFGPNDLPFEAPATHNGVFYPHFHTGLDISAPLDTPIHAAADGRVILATASVDDQGRLVGYGNYVAIAHAGGLTTVYGHMDTMAVKPGQIVHQGDVIGLEGSTGNSTGPHVHFETRLSGGIVDPQPYLSGQIHR